MRRAVPLLALLALGCAQSVVADGGPARDAGVPRDADTSPASPTEFCINERFWLCRRDLAGGRIDEGQYNMCLEPISAACEGAAWPAGCAPTNEQANACIIELSRSDRVSESNETLLAEPVCRLCP
ncbi:MAG: hypothetical protein H6719_28105 [Sandaracinaceae bacterium]|nr:hypothetical protein [Sandaracinaceae bacterium]